MTSASQDGRLYLDCVELRPRYTKLCPAAVKRLHALNFEAQCVREESLRSFIGAPSLRSIY